MFNVRVNENFLTSVPNIAYIMIVPNWSKKALLGIKYPASTIIGGRRIRKNVVVSSWYCSDMPVKKKMTPRIAPMMISKQLSGNKLDTRLME